MAVNGKEWTMNETESASKLDKLTSAVTIGPYVWCWHRTCPRHTLLFFSQLVFLLALSHSCSVCVRRVVVWLS